jgi:ribosome-binding protein aMBF1 (putative translation factor)
MMGKDLMSQRDAEKLQDLQNKCDMCKEAIVHEHDVPIREAMQDVCEVCQRVRTRIPDLMELRRKLAEFNEGHKR